LVRDLVRANASRVEAAYFGRQIALASERARIVRKISKRLARADRRDGLRENCGNRVDRAAVVGYHDAGLRKSGLERERMNVRAISLVGAFLHLLGVPAPAATLRGEALYLARIALPPQAVFEAVLQDVSRADAPADVLGRARLDPAGQPPFRFEIVYDDAALRPGRRYAVRGDVTLDGKLLFTTDRFIPAFDGAKPLELLLVQATGRPNSSDVALRNSYWKLTRLGGSPVHVSERQSEPHLILAQGKMQVSGSGGCNRFTGGYTLEGDTLRFSRMASTMMACVDGMEQERRFFSDLAKVARYRIAGDQLELLDDSGAAVLLFTAVALR
jgi:putative lipoprotein